MKSKILTYAISMSLLMTFSSSVYAVAHDVNNLTTALEHAYDNSPLLKMHQQDFMRHAEALPQTIAAHFLPDIRASTSRQNSKRNPLEDSVISGRAKYYAEHPELIDKNKTTIDQGSVEIKQNIFKSGGSVASLGAAQYIVKSAKALYYDNEQKFLLDAVKVYLNYIQSKKTLDAANAYVAAARTSAEATEEKFKVGEGTRIDTSASRSALAKAHYEQAQADAQYSAAKSQFEQLFGQVPELDLEFPKIDKSNLPASFDEFKSNALSRSLILQQAKYSAQKIKYETLAQASELLPRADVSASWSRVDYNQDIIDIHQYDNKSYTTAITLSVPILPTGGAEYSKIREKKIESRRSVHQLSQIERELETAIIADWQSYDASSKQASYGAEEVLSKEIQYEGTKSAQVVGMKTIVDVLNVEYELFQARINEIKAKNDNVLAYYKIQSDIAKLTAKDLGLNVKMFNPDKELDKVRFKIVGF